MDPCKSNTGRVLEFFLSWLLFIMVFQKIETFALHNYEGPLDFLLYLIQKDEIEISSISIHEITKQFLKKLQNWKEGRLDFGAEFISTTAQLLWLKSKHLLPNDAEEELLSTDEREDPNFDVIHHLIDYCRFKEAAKNLSKREEEQNAFFFRGTGSPEFKKPFGIDHISLEELSSLFNEMMKKAKLEIPKIYEENWKISDKIRMLRTLLKEQSQLKMTSLFPLSSTRLEWIVIFLAILELMKIGELAVGRQQNSLEIIIYSKTGQP